MKGLNSRIHQQQRFCAEVSNSGVISENSNSRTYKHKKLCKQEYSLTCPGSQMFIFFLFYLFFFNLFIYFYFSPFFSVMIVMMKFQQSLMKIF